jgi:hypothetical protein
MISFIKFKQIKKMLNEGIQIQNFVLCDCEAFCDTILLRLRNLIYYGSGSDSRIRIRTIR